jgi:DNA-binding transcriptional regulator YiaG
MTPKQVAQLLKDLDLTHQQLADLIGCHRVTVTDWVRGANKPMGLYRKALEQLAAKAKRKKEIAK